LTLSTSHRQNINDDPLRRGKRRSLLYVTGILVPVGNQDHPSRRSTGEQSHPKTQTASDVGAGAGGSRLDGDDRRVASETSFDEGVSTENHEPSRIALFHAT